MHEEIATSYWPDTHAFLNVGWRHLVAQIDNKFSKLLNIDDILWIVRVGVDDFRATSHL